MTHEKHVSSGTRDATTVSQTKVKPPESVSGHRDGKGQENLGIPGGVIANTLKVPEMALRDAERIEYLAKLIRNCPHAQITFCDDPACEEGAVGFMIRVEGCETSEVCALTLRECIDKDMALHLSPHAPESDAGPGVSSEDQNLERPGDVS